MFLLLLVPNLNLLYLRPRFLQLKFFLIELFLPIVFWSLVNDLKIIICGKNHLIKCSLGGLLLNISYEVVFYQSPHPCYSIVPPDVLKLKSRVVALFSSRRTDFQYCGQAMRLGRSVMAQVCLSLLSSSVQQWSSQV